MVETFLASEMKRHASLRGHAEITIGKLPRNYYMPRNPAGEEALVRKPERRENKRYRVKSGIVALMLPDRLKIVQICDISASGLSFTCQQFGLMKHRMYEIDILLLNDVRHPDRDIFFPNVKCTLVETDLLSNPAAYSLQQMTRCSVRFQTKLPLESDAIKRVAREEPEACEKMQEAEIISPSHDLFDGAQMVGSESQLFHQSGITL